MSTLVRTEMLLLIPILYPLASPTLNLIFFSGHVSHIVFIFGCSTKNSRYLDNQIKRAPHYTIAALAMVDIWFEFVPQRFMC